MEDNIIVEKDASIGEVDRKWFEENIGSSLDQILKRNEASHEVFSFNAKINWLKFFIHRKKLSSWITAKHNPRLGNLPIFCV